MSSLLEFKCPKCGGSVTFDSESQMMKCPYCDTELDVESLRALDEELKNTPGDDMTWDAGIRDEWSEDEASGMRIYICESCGGEVMAEETQVASSCPYCGNPIVMKGGVSGNLRPDYVIPFKLTKEAAVEGLKKHISKKLLLPKSFRTDNHIEDVKGLYVPVWIFDANANGSARYNATKVRTWSTLSWVYTETSHYKVFRYGSMGFERVPVDGSKKMENELMESIEPFNFREAVDFQTAYLSGYLADRYDVPMEECSGIANSRIKNSLSKALEDTVNGYVSVQKEHEAIQLTDSSAKYALYPVWLLQTKYKDRQYYFIMNGQTGKFAGNLPASGPRFAAWLFGLTAGIGIVLSLVFHFAGILL